MLGLLPTAGLTINPDVPGCCLWYFSTCIRQGYEVSDDDDGDGDGNGDGNGDDNGDDNGDGDEVKYGGVDDDDNDDNHDNHDNHDNDDTHDNDNDDNGDEAGSGDDN